MPIPPTLEASFVALATDTAALITAERAAWKHEDEVLVPGAREGGPALG